MELARCSIPVVAAKAAGPSPVVGIVEAVETVEVARVAPEPADPGPEVMAEVADHPSPVALAIAAAVEEPAGPGHSAAGELADSIPVVLETAVVGVAGPGPAVVGGPSHSASRAAVRPRTLQRRVQRGPAGHCEYAARCRARSAQPLPQ